MAVFNIFSSILTARGLASIRSDFPLLFALIPLSGAQCLAIYSLPAALTLFLVLVSLLIFAAGESRRLTTAHIAALFFALGMMSSLPAWSIESQNLNSEYSYFVRVDEEPRYRRPGQVNLSLTVLGIFQTESGREWSTKPKLSKAEGRVLCRAVHLPWKNIYQVRNGSLLVIRARFHKIPDTAGPFDYNSSLLRKSYSARCKIEYATMPDSISRSWISRLRESLRTQVREVLGSGEKSGLLLSMAFGQKDLIGVRTEVAFKRSGLAHLLVVSGYHVTLVYGLMFWLFRAALLNNAFLFRTDRAVQLACLSALSITFFYVGLVGLAGSSLRAATAISFFVASRLLEKGGGMLNSIYLSMIVVSIVWPGALFDLGIQLTYASLLGIYLGLEKSSLLNPVKTASTETYLYSLLSHIPSYLSICFWATLTSGLPVLLRLDYFSLAAFATNALIAPFLAFTACKLGVISTGLLSTGLDPAGAMLQATTYLLQFMKQAVLYVSDLSWSCFQVDGIWKWLLVLMHLMLIYKKICFRARLYLLNRGIYWGR